MKLRIENKLTINFTLSILFVCLMGSWFFLVNSKEDGINTRIYNSGNAKDILELSISNQYHALELFNNFIITRDLEKIRGINLLREAQYSNINNLKKILADDPPGLQNINLLEKDINNSFNYFNTIYIQASRKAYAAPGELKITAIARAYASGIRRIAKRINASENNKVKILSSQIENLTLTNRLIIFTGILIAVIFLIASYRSTKKDVLHKIKSEYDLRVLGMAIRSINECVVITDCNNKVLFINEAFKKIYGYSGPEIIGKDIALIYSKRNPKHLVEEIFGNLIMEGWSGEIIQSTKNGSEIIAQVSGSAVKNDEGNTIAVVSVMSDITEKKKTQEEVERYIEELQVNKDILEQNAEELLELNVKLYESEQQLKELNENKDKFFSIISHDLRSPFSSLIGLSDILVNEMETLSNEEINYFSQNINNTSKSVLNLVDRLLQWSRLQTGRIEFAPKTISLFKIINDISEILKGNLIKKNIVLHNEVRENILVYADENMITSVMQNLISNALKFTEENGDIIISDEDTDKFVEVSIKDNGIGMTDEMTKKLFNIETNSTTLGTAHESGSGLGLILCKELVEKNNGKIYVKSNIGVGTTFLFTVPKGEILQDQL